MNDHQTLFDYVKFSRNRYDDGDDDWDRDDVMGFLKAFDAMEEERDEAREEMAHIAAERDDWKLGSDVEASAHDEAREELSTLRVRLALLEDVARAFVIDVAHSTADRQSGGQHTGPSGGTFYGLSPGARKSLQRYADEFTKIFSKE